MSSGDSPVGPGEVLRDQDYDGVDLILQAAAFLDEISASQSDPNQLDPRHFDGVNLLVGASEILASNSSTLPDPDYDGVKLILQAAAFLDEISASQSDPNQLDPRHFDGVNLLLEAAEILAANSSTAHSDPDQGDQRRGRHFEGVNTRVPPPVSTLPSNSSQKKDPECRPIRMRYTEEQQEAIRILRDDRCMSWVQVSEAYKLGRYADGTPWEPRTPAALNMRYSLCGFQNARSDPNHPRSQKCATSTSISRSVGYTKDQEEAIRVLKDDRNLPWPQIVEIYNQGCNADGTPWVARSKEALQAKYRAKARTTSKSTLSYTQEQEELIRSLKNDDRGMSWDQITAEYNSRCYEDGTPWEKRSKIALTMRYSACQMRGWAKHSGG